MRFIVDHNLAHEPAWWLVDDKGRTIAWAGRTFETLAYADQAAHDFRVDVAEPIYRFHVRASGTWRWTAWHGEGRIAISGDWFPSEQAAREAAEQLRDQLAVAVGP